MNSQEPSNTKPIKLVLITSGIDHLTTRFHQLPEQATAIIEVGDWDWQQHLRYALRRCIRTIQRQRFPDCQQYCKQHNLLYFRVKAQNLQAITALLHQCEAELVITFKCPVIPMDTLTHLRFGAINLHSALLPDYRGGNPLFWQVINNEAEIGCTVHKLSAGLDEGDILEQTAFTRPKNIHHKDLNYLATVTHGLPLLKSAVEKIASGQTEARKQLKHENLNKAPNCDWQTWRELAKQRGLSEEQKKDIACFVGESCQATVPGIKINE